VIRAALTVACLLLCGAAPRASAEVRAEDHDAFFLWSGVAPQPVLARARSVYVLDGQIDDDRGRTRLIAQGRGVPRLRRGKAWIVYRAHTLRWTPEIYARMLARIERWRRAGNPIVGIQIDFDARTRHLDAYAEFLHELRQRLPREYRLSITGLMDWSRNAPAPVLNRIADVVDEVVVQTYQGRHTIPGHADYLAHLEHLKLPFRIALAQHGEWQPPRELESNPWFRGYVVFLQNP
jgi:hypothetical protein